MIYFLHKNEKVQEKNTHKFLSSTYFSPISVLPKKTSNKQTNKQTNERKSLCRHCKKYGKNKFRQTYGWLNIFAMFAGKTL